MWTLAERLTYVRFERLAGKLAIVDAWRWSIHLQSG